MSILFISDLHLCPSRPEINRIFFHFLAGPARAAQALYILGDLFEYWAGDDDLNDPFSHEVCAALRALTDAGVPVFFMAGNRDFLIGDVFAQAAGLTLLADTTLLDIAGTPTLLMHGDTLCTDDVDYQRFRTLVRSPQWQHNFLSLPLTERKAQIAALRRESEAQKRIKAMDIMDVNAEAVVEAFREHGCTRQIHGHTHRPAHHVIDVEGLDCERWVLPDWYDSWGYLRCTEDGCVLHSFKPPHN